jgi:cytochrome P450
MPSNNIPVAKGLPLFGNLFHLMGSYPYKPFVEAYQDLGPIFKVAIAGYKIMIMGGPEANLFLAKEGKNFLSNREIFSEMEKEFKPGLIIALDGEAHRKTRKVMEKFLHPDQLKTYISPMIQSTVEYLKDWNTGETIEVMGLMKRLICRQTALTLLHVSPDEQFENIEYFFDTVVRATATAYKPFYHWKLRSSKYLNAKASFFSFMQDVIEKRKQTGLVDEFPDMLDILLTLSHEDGELLNEDEIFLCAIFPFVVGMDTTATTLSFLMYEILKNETIKQQILEEIDIAFARGLPGLEDLRKMKTLRFAVMETLRLYPVGFMMQRYVKQDFNFMNCKISAGEKLFIAPGISHFLPKFFPDPYQFDIERYSSTRQEHKQPGAYTPFSIGPHACPGAGLAEIQMMLTVASILYMFEPQLDPLDYELKTTLFARKSAILSPKRSIYMKANQKQGLHPRKFDLLLQL